MNLNAGLLHFLWLALTRRVIGSHDIYPLDHDDLQPHGQCEPITMPICQNIEYNQTMMPNLLGHQKQIEAAAEMHVYFPLLKVNCSPDFQFFLCSVYAPVCTEVSHPIPPCRSLCISAKNGCEEIMNKFGFSWPERLNCSQFPESGPGILCVSKNNTNTTELDEYAAHTTEALEHPKAKDSAKDFTKDFPFTCPDHFRIGKGYDDVVRVGGLTVKHCGMPCDRMFFSRDERRFARAWIGGWSALCAASCLFTVLTFAIKTERFRYPERPIIFLSLCYLVVASVYVVGFVVGDRAACRRPFALPSDKPRLQPVSTIAQGTKGELCTIMFIGLYFFGMASSIWWVVLALTWFLAAGLKWGHEAIEANSQYFHLAAWAVPAVKTITILAMGKVEGDVLTGVCFVGLWDPETLRTFVLAPLFVYLVLGTVFLLLGFVSLFRIRTAMKHDGTKTDKLEKLMLRIGIFSVLYTVPALTVVVCLFYEQRYHDQWMVTWHRQMCQPTPDNMFLIRCPAPGVDSRPNFAVFMLKYLMSLIVGITSSVWIWSGKTVSNWRELFQRIKGKKPPQYV